MGYPISRQRQIGRLMLKFNGQYLTRSMGSEIRTFQKRHVQKVHCFLRIFIVIHPSSLLYTIWACWILGKIHVTVILEGHFGCWDWSSSTTKDLEADVVFLQQRLANLQSQNGCASHGRPEIGARLNQFAGRYSEFMHVVLYGSLLSVLFKETRSRLNPIPGRENGKRSSWSQQPRSLIDIPLENLCWQLPAADFMALSMAGGLV